MTDFSAHEPRRRRRGTGRSLVCLALASCLCPRGVAAEGGEAAVLNSPVTPDAAERGLPSELFWVSASAALVTFSLGGLHGLRAFATHDRAKELPAVDPARLQLRDEIARDETAADYLFISAAVLAAGSVALALFTDWRAIDPPAESARTAPVRVMPAAGRAGVGLSLRGELF